MTVDEWLESIDGSPVEPCPECESLRELFQIEGPECFWDFNIFPHELQQNRVQ